MKEKGLSVGTVWIGNRKEAWLRYIKQTLARVGKADKDFVFVTYVGMEEEDLKWIEDTIRGMVKFEHIYFQRASATISLNCGPGTFGLLFIKKKVKFCHISTLLSRYEKQVQQEHLLKSDLADEIETSPAIPEESAQTEGMPSQIAPAKEMPEKVSPAGEDDLFDVAVGLRSCGSKAGYDRALMLFLEAGDEKAKELEDYFAEENWEQYTIKAYALKSSARLVGAMNLGEMAYALEMAGKEGRILDIREGHRGLCDELAKVLDNLKERFGEPEGDSSKPMADGFLIEGAFDAIREAAETSDKDMVMDALEELQDYRLEKKTAELFEKIREAAKKEDYDTILDCVNADR